MCVGRSLQLSGFLEAEFHRAKGEQGTLHTSHAQTHAAHHFLDFVQSHSGDFLRRFADGLKDGIGGLEAVSNIRNKGLMIAADFDRDTPPLVQIALDHGVLVNATAGNVMRLLPPLIATDEEADAMIERIMSAVKEFLQ